MKIPPVKVELFHADGRHDEANIRVLQFCKTRLEILLYWNK